MAACHCSGCCWSWCPPYSSTSRPQCPKSCTTFGFWLESQRHDVLFFPSEGLALLQRIHILRCLRVTWDNHSIRQTATWAFAPFSMCLKIQASQTLDVCSAFKKLDQLNPIEGFGVRQISRHIHFQYGHRSDKVVTPAAGSTNSATNSQCCNDLIQHETASTWPKCSNNGEVSGWTSPV